MRVNAISTFVNCAICAGLSVFFREPRKYTLTFSRKICTIGYVKFFFTFLLDHCRQNILHRVGNSRPTSLTMSDVSASISPRSTRRSDRLCRSTIYGARQNADRARLGRALGPRATDNIAARGSESDTVNSLTRLLRVLLLEPSRIIVATLPGSPWHSYHQKYRWKACLLAVRYPLETRSLVLEWFSSSPRVKLLNRIFPPPSPQPQNRARERTREFRGTRVRWSAKIVRLSSRTSD